MKVQISYNSDKQSKIIEGIATMDDDSFAGGFTFRDTAQKVVSFVPYSDDIASIDVVDETEEKCGEVVDVDPYAGEFSLLPNGERLMPGDVVDNSFSLYLVSNDRQAIFIGKSPKRYADCGVAFNNGRVYSLTKGVLISEQENIVYRGGKVLWSGRFR